MEHRLWRLAGVAVLLGCLALASGCGGITPTSSHGKEHRAPNFGLADLNNSSPTYGQIISPRDFLGGVSAWYFGRST